MAGPFHRSPSNALRAPDPEFPPRIGTALAAPGACERTIAWTACPWRGGGIAKQIAEGKNLPREIEDQILAKSEGVPLFIEELTKVAIESGMLVDTGDGYTLSGRLSALTVPATLKDSLMARLDRLGSAKELAQTGACIGRVFHHRLIAGVAGANGARLAEALRRLEDSDL